MCVRQSEVCVPPKKVSVSRMLLSKVESQWTYVNFTVRSTVSLSDSVPLMVADRLGLLCAQGLSLHSASELAFKIHLRLCVLESHNSAFADPVTIVWRTELGPWELQLAVGGGQLWPYRIRGVVGLGAVPVVPPHNFFS